MSRLFFILVVVIAVFSQVWGVFGQYKSEQSGFSDSQMQKSGLRFSSAEHASRKLSEAGQAVADKATDTMNSLKRAADDLSQTEKAQFGGNSVSRDAEVKRAFDQQGYDAKSDQHSSSAADLFSASAGDQKEASKRVNGPKIEAKKAADGASFFSQEEARKAYDEKLSDATKQRMSDHVSEKAHDSKDALKSSTSSDLHENDAVRAAEKARQDAQQFNEDLVNAKTEPAAQTEYAKATERRAAAERRGSSSSIESEGIVSTEHQEHEAAKEKAHQQAFEQRRARRLSSHKQRNPGGRRFAGRARGRH